MIEIQDLTVRFGGVTPLDNVSMRFPAGTCGLIGPNGAGKTTLFNVLSGFVAPQSGSVRAFDDTRRSPTWISPSVGSRKPAISRKVVVLPQPDGPSRQTSCPWSIRKETSSTAASAP